MERVLPNEWSLLTRGTKRGILLETRASANKPVAICFYFHLCRLCGRYSSLGDRFVNYEPLFVLLDFEFQSIGTWQATVLETTRACGGSILSLKNSKRHGTGGRWGGYS